MFTSKSMITMKKPMCLASWNLRYETHFERSHFQESDQIQRIQRSILKVIFLNTI